MKHNSADVIRRRLLKNASTLLNVSHSEIATFDPVVNMIFGACSKELEKLYHEQENSKSRVLDRLSKLLLPEVSSGPFPAHAVVHARPYENRSVLKKTAQFYHRKKRKASESSYKDKFIDFHFAPIDDTEIINANIELTCSASGLHKFGGELIGPLASRPTKWSESSYWVGLDLSRIAGQTNDLSFFFDWPSHPEQKRMLDVLPSVNAYIDGTQVKARIGNSKSVALSDDSRSFENIGLSGANRRTLRAYYSKHFLSLDLSAIDLTKKLHVPKALAECIDAEFIGQVDNNLLWINFEFPPFISHDLLDEMVCNINAVPICNLQLNEFSFRIQPNFNIVPLDVGEDTFYQVISVRSSDGREYISSSIADSNKINNGEYIIRKGGVERFDQRNATEMLGYLVDLLRDESASFAIFGHEAISENLTNLNKEIAALELRTQSRSNDRETATYIMVQPRSSNDNVFVEYWTTAGNQANNIKLGTTLKLSSNADVRAAELVLLTNATGGRDPLTDRDGLKDFRSALTNRDRIVTKADIHSFCDQEVGDHVKNIAIGTKFKIDPKKNSSFKKVIEITLTPNRKKHSVEEWNSMIFSLKAKIESRSSHVFPIDIVVL